MLKIKLSPLGKAHAIKYRVVIMEENSKLTKDAREVLGYYDPRHKKLEIDNGRLQYWLKMGAQPTKTIRELCKIS